MNIDKFTAHAKSIIANAQGLAAKNDNQQILPLHLLDALLNEDTGIIANLINIVGGNLPSLQNRVQAELNKIPKVQVEGGGQIYFSSEGMKLLEKATSLSKDNNDTFTTIERIFEALTYDNTVAGKILAENSINSKKVASAILQLRK